MDTAPRANHLASVDRVWLGHMLATYALPFVREGEAVGGAWKQSILAALASARTAFPGGTIVCSMDKRPSKNGGVSWDTRVGGNTVVDEKANPATSGYSINQHTKCQRAASQWSCHGELVLATGRSFAVE